MFIQIHDHLLSLELKIALPHQIHHCCYWQSSPSTCNTVATSLVLLGPCSYQLKANIPWVIHVCQNIPCLYTALAIPQPPWVYLAEGLVYHRKMGRAVLTAPSEVGVYAALSDLGKGGTHSPWETVSGEAGVNWLFNNKQAQFLLFYYFYAYSTHTHSVWWDCCLRLPPKSCKNRSPLSSCWFCCMS